MPLCWIFWLLAAISTSQMAVAEPLPSSENHSAVTSKTPITYPIDINHADLKGLSHIKGLGKKRAQAIIQYRQQHGNFHTINDLAQVKGFTQKRLQTFLSKNQGKITTLH